MKIWILLIIEMIKSWVALSFKTTRITHFKTFSYRICEYAFLYLVQSMEKSIIINASICLVSKLYKSWTEIVILIMYKNNKFREMGTFIIQFNKITGNPECAVSMKYLQFYNWNVRVSISYFFIQWQNIFEEKNSFHSILRN